jgi:hypothetical protein
MVEPRASECVRTQLATFAAVHGPVHLHADAWLPNVYVFIKIPKFSNYLITSYVLLPLGLLGGMYRASQDCVAMTMLWHSLLETAAMPQNANQHGAAANQAQ